VAAALLIGLVLSFVGSMPVAGPIAVVVLSRGLSNQRRSGLFIAVGAAIAECVYAGLAFLGIAAVLHRYPLLLPVSRLLACLLLTGLGAYFLLRPPGRSEGHDRAAVRARATTDAGNALLGFSVTALNPTLIVTWTAAVGAAHATGLLRVREIDALPFAGGVATGIVAWFATLLAALARFQKKLRPETVRAIIKVMGGALLVAGVGYGVRTVLTWGVG
jgi:threonine/homoserine/homoserine lactone efflux protein